MTRLASPPPSACAACFGQYPDRRHVDFEAAYDGPVLEGAARVAIDDLIVCENCLADGARILGWVPDQEAREQLAALRVRAAEAEARNEGQAAYIRKLEDALAARPAPATRKRAA